MSWCDLILVILLACATFFVVLFLRTSVRRSDKRAKLEGIDSLITAEFTSASKPMQYAFAIAMPRKYANRTAKTLHLNIDALNRFKTRGDVIKARMLIFITLCMILSLLIKAFFC